jgi:hypothetical protein
LARREKVVSKSYLFAGVTLLLGVVGVGCGEDGDDDVAHSNEAVGVLCQRTCERAVAKKCNATSKDSCESQCNQTAVATPAPCASELNAFLTCTSRASYSCDAPTGRADAVGCLDSFELMNSCAAAHPGSTGSVASDAGTTTGDAGVVPSDAGATPSNVGSTPVDSGSQSGSDAGPLHHDAGAPVVTAGSDAGSSVGSDAGAAPDAGPTSAGSCAAEADDDACDTCGKTKCCAVVSACVSDADCATLGACVSDCDTQDCQQACADAATDAALDKFNASISCYSDTCEAECGGEDHDGTPNDGTANNGEPDNCLPSGVPAGYCTDASHPVGHECTVAPAGDCVPLPNVGDVYCCAK